MQINLFAEDNQLERLSKLGDPLEKLKVVNFEVFRPVLKDALEKERKSNAGRPAFDYVMMFKIIVLMTTYNLSFDQVEYQFLFYNPSRFRYNTHRFFAAIRNFFLSSIDFRYRL